MPDFKIDVHHHLDGDDAQLARIERKLDQILKGEKQIMATVAELESELNDINATTTAQGATLAAMGTTLTEVSSDIDDLIAKANAGDISGAVAIANSIRDSIAANGTTLQSTADALTAVAAKHTP